MGVNYKLYALNSADEWHLIFVGYSEKFAKSFLEGIRWSRRIGNLWYGIGPEGFYYKVEEDQLG